MNHKCHEGKEESLIDELIKLKIPNPSERTTEKIIELTQQICLEANEIMETNQESNDQSHNLIGSLNRDNFPEDVIPFVVVKKDDTFVSYQCPICKLKSKYALKRFEKSQYMEYECLNCRNKFLMKLNFQPSIKIFLEVNENVKNES